MSKVHLPVIPLRVEKDGNGFGFYNDNLGPGPNSCVCCITWNVSGGVTMAAECIRVLGIKAFTVGDKVFDKQTRRWV